MIGLSRLLDNLGFNHNTIVESILTTQNIDNSLNAAPMGVTRIGQNLLKIKPFISSTSFLNLKIGETVCINTTSDPMLFLVTAFKEYLKDQPKINFDLSIDRCDASLYCEIVEIKAVLKTRVKANLKVEQVKVWNPMPRVFNRGQAEAIEAVIHATRVKAFKDNPLKSAFYLKKIHNCNSVIRRVSPEESTETEVVEIIKQLIDSWGFER
jgi:hypothetical protein